NAPLRAVEGERQVAVAAKGDVVLRDLIALGQVRVKVVLTVELGKLRYLAVQRQRGHDRVLDRLLIDDGERPWKAHTNWAVVGIGRRVRVIGRTPAKHLALSQQLRVDLKADHDLKVHRGLG